MDALLQAAAARAGAYRAGIGRRPVAASAEAVTALARLGGSLPNGPIDPLDVLALLDDVGSPATVASTGRRYFGFVTGGVHPAALAAAWLATTWDQNAALRVMSPVAAHLEDVVLGWLIDLLHLPEESGGAFVTGATMANFTGLAAARHAVLARAGYDVEEDGLFGAPPVTVVVGAEAHATLYKAIALLGLGSRRVVTVPVDTQGRMRAEALPSLDARTIVCAQAGNVNSGAIDPLDAICDAATAAGAWVHVDGAFGLWAAASPRLAPLTRGLERADSMATDAHKWLNTSYDSGIVLVRDPTALRAAFSVNAAYLVASDQREPSQYTPETSRRARAIEVWAVLRSLGRTGLAELIDGCCRHARRFADGLSAAGYEVLNDVVLNQVCVHFVDDDITRQVVSAVQDEGTCWVGATVWHGRAAMRISVSSWATTEEDVERSLAAIVGVAARIAYR